MALSLSTPKVPNYILAEKIGSGSFADVYKAYRKGPKREVVAIKCVLKTNLSKTSLDNLVTEIEILKKLKHDHIVVMKDFLWDERYIFIVMEYCNGGDLSRFIKLKQRLSESVCQRFLQQLASALKYMREQNVSHFDLKPQNILITSIRHPVIKIADFGLAQHMMETDTSGTIKGSPLYMAPEIVLTRKYNVKVDLWSVGVILYECLFGAAPYSSKSFNELIEKIKTDKQIEIPHGTNISRNCRDFILRCLQRDVSNRIGFEDFFNHPFIDLEHKPSQENMEKATDLLKYAVNHDQCKEYQEAYRCYCEALLYLAPALHAEGDSVKRAALRRKTTGYLQRSETLKKAIRNNNESLDEIDIPELPKQTASSASSSTTEYHGNRDELLRLSSSTPQIKTALDIGASGELYAHEGSYATALEKYQLSLGCLLPLMKTEPKGRRKDLLTEEAKRWMTQAEYIKQYLDPGSYTEPRDEPAGSDSTAATISEGDIDKNCCIQ